MRKARISNNTVCEVLELDPFPPFHPSLVWVECGSDIQPGWTYDGSIFTPPTPIVEPDKTAENILALWQAAHDYEYEQISGSAIGLLTIGVLQQKPKCVAVEAWISSIWTLYYQRKPLITTNVNLELLDFSSCGTIPYTVPELRAELSI